jgi:ParB family transcriptional regulator, chromosome partitioning protein
MEHTQELLMVPLADLVPSPYNVRRHTSGQVESLAALIASQGLFHPLIVTEQMGGRGKARRVRFAVAAGERRRRALVLLHQQGRLPKGHEVRCELVPPERAREISLAENSGREAMHPADEFEAFQALIADGKGVEDVAARFGVSVLTVQRRLRLSAVSPKLLALYREDGINLDQLMALAISDDHDAQERAWWDAPPWGRTPVALRRTLTSGEVEAATSALAHFVGVEAYEAAGGGVRRDLFDEAQNRFLSDPGLLQRLALEKLDRLADPVRRDGWSWVEVRLEVDSQALRTFTPCAHGQRSPTDQEQAELDRLAARDAELDLEAEAMEEATEWSAEQAERIDLEQQDIAVRRRAIQEACKVWSPKAKALAGVIVTVGREGEVEVLRGLVREADRKAWVGAERSQRVEAPDHPDGRPEREEQPVAGADSRSTGCSERLSKRLAAHRTVALQVLLSRHTPVALAALAHVLVLRTFAEGYRSTESALQITPQLSTGALEAVADDLRDSPAGQALAASKQAWQDRLAESSGDWLGWLIALPQAELLELVGLCAALTLNALPGAGGAGEVNRLADAVQLDMADWWSPTAQGYLQHVPKALIAQALQEAGQGLSDTVLATMKKEALVVHAASRLWGSRWLPVPLRHAPG